MSTCMATGQQDDLRASQQWCIYKYVHMHDVHMHGRYGQAAPCPRSDLKPGEFLDLGAPAGAGVQRMYSVKPHMTSAVDPLSGLRVSMQREGNTGNLQLQIPLRS